MEIVQSLISSPQSLMMNDIVWQTTQLTQTYLEGVRGAIPLAQEQIDVMLRLIRAACPTVTAVLDLGCGDGILGQAVLDQHPEAHGVFLDFSEPMLAAARQRLAGYERRATIVLADYGKKTWSEETAQSPISNLQSLVSNPRWDIGQSPISNLFDVVVSGFSIHHQPDERKKEVYAELYDLLKPGGIFLNLEHVASPTRWLEERFEEHFIDALVAYHTMNGSGKTAEQVARDYYNRPDKVANILTPVETQCDWLREIGFEHVDCYLKIFELALFGGIKGN